MTTWELEAEALNLAGAAAIEPVDALSLVTKEWVEARIAEITDPEGPTIGYPRPTVEDLATYLQVDPTTPLLDVATATAIAMQDSVCDTTGYTVALWYAAIRRGARWMTARSSPLGMIDLGDLGAMHVPQWDAEIQAAERPYLTEPFA